MPSNKRQPPENPGSPSSNESNDESDQGYTGMHHTAPNAYGGIHHTVYTENGTRISWDTNAGGQVVPDTVHVQPSDKK